MRLTDTEWKIFKIGDLFNITRPEKRSEKDYNPGGVPFVAAGNTNNGVTGWYNSGDEILDRGNTITISPIDGSAFYQPVAFLGRGGAGSSIFILENEQLNKYNALFICQMIENTCCKYNYGHMAKASSITRDYINLPTQDGCTPDWKFCEGYIKEREHNLLQLYFSKLSEITRPVGYKDIPTASLLSFHMATTSNYLTTKRVQGNCIVKTTTGQLQYKKEAFIPKPGTKIARAPFINFYTGTYICTNVSKDGKIIKLPVNSNYMYDWDFCKNYVKNELPLADLKNR